MEAGGTGNIIETGAVVSSPPEQESLLIETAVVRSTYARWCGGTAAQAASYPISRKLAQDISRYSALEYPDVIEHVNW